MREGDDIKRLESAFRALAGILGVVAGVCDGVFLSVVDGRPWPLLAGPVLGLVIVFLTNSWISSELNARFSRMSRAMGGWVRFAVDCAFAAIVTIAAHLLYRALYPHGLGVVFLLFMLPAAASALFVSTRCAALSSILAFLYVLYFAIPPDDSFRIETFYDLASALVFAAILGTAVCVVRATRLLCGNADAPPVPG